MGVKAGSAKCVDARMKESLEAGQLPPPPPDATHEEMRLYEIQTAARILGVQVPQHTPDKTDVAGSPSVEQIHQNRACPPSKSRMAIAREDFMTAESDLVLLRESLSELQQQEASLPSEAEGMKARVEECVSHARMMVKKLTEPQLQEVAALQNPPPACQRTVEMVYAMLNEGKVVKKPPWSTARRQVIFEMVPSIQRGTLPTLTLPEVECIRKEFMEANTLTPQIVKRANQACHALFLWASAVLTAMEEIAKVTEVAAAEAQLRAEWEEKTLNLTIDIQAGKALVHAKKQHMESLPFEACFAD